MPDSSRWQALEKSLGPAGRLGFAARFFSPSSALQEEISFNADNVFPMASTAKIAVAMLASSRVASGELALDQTIHIDPVLFAPGLARSPLDHFFYWPFQTRRTETVDTLLGFMIHQSDNTATDTLIQKLGGVAGVNAFVADLGVSGFHLKRTFAQLVDFYYGLKLTSGRRPNIVQIAASIHRLRPPYVWRETTERALIETGDDCCTPRAMADLLTVLATAAIYAPAYSHMRQCAGGRHRIRAGLAECKDMIKTFGHKTGSLGGVANDAGIVQFTNGSFAVICVMTALASAPMNIRDEQIAGATRLAIASAVHRDGLPARGLRSV
jgi:beta-lactamase class A